MNGIYWTLLIVYSGFLELFQKFIFYFLLYLCLTDWLIDDFSFQLSSLSRHAEDLFGEMITESTSILNRTVSLQGRVDKLSVKVKNLDSNVEEGKGPTDMSTYIMPFKYVLLPGKGIDVGIYTGADVVF